MSWAKKNSSVNKVHCNWQDVNLNNLEFVGKFKQQIKSITGHASSSSSGGSDDDDE